MASRPPRPQSGLARSSRRHPRFPLASRGSLIPQERGRGRGSRAGPHVPTHVSGRLSLRLARVSPRLRAERRPGLQGQARFGVAQRQVPLQELKPQPHAFEPDARNAVTPRRQAGAEITNREQDHLAGDPQPHDRLLAAGMAVHVGQGFLNDAVERDLGGVGQAGKSSGMSIVTATSARREKPVANCRIAAASPRCSSAGG
jgi:hypothetical protein